MGAGKGKSKRTRASIAESPKQKGWKINTSNFIKAQKILGLCRPVRIVRGDWKSRKGGYYPEGRVHVIEVRRHFSPREASQTIWHELKHAQQVERLGGYRQFEQAYDKQLAALGDVNVTKPRKLTRTEKQKFYTMPLEAAARKFEARHSKLPLCQPK